MLFLTMTTVAAAIVHAAPIAGGPDAPTNDSATNESVAIADGDAASDAASDEVILRRYDLDDLDIAMPVDEGVGWGLPQNLFVPVLRGEVFDIAFEGHGSDEYMDFESFLFEMLGDEADEIGVATMRLSETSILVSASERSHAYITEQLDIIRRMQAGDAQLSVSRWTVDELPGDLRPGLVSLATAQDWIEQLADVGSGATRHVVADAHRDTRIASGSSTDVLVDVHLEIAQEAAALDPEVRRIPIGVEGSVRAAPGDGGWHVAFHLESIDASRASADDEKTFSMATDGSTSYLGGISGSPWVRTTGIATDAFVPDGRALVLVESTEADATVTIVGATGGNSSIVQSHGDTHVVELGAALRPRVFGLRSDLELNERAPGPIVLGASWEDEANLFVCGLESDFVDGLYDPLSVLVDLETRRLDDAGDDSVDMSYEVFELVAERSWSAGPTYGALVVPKSLPWIGETGAFGDAFVERGAELVRALAAPRANRQVRVRVTEAGDVINEFHVSMRVGSTSSFVDMTEELVLVDFDVEVAENSAAIDPGLRTSASGLCLTLELRGREGALLLEASGSWQREVALRSGFEHALIGPLQAVLADGEVFTGVQALRPGEACLWGDVSGRGVRLEVELVE